MPLTSSRLRIGAVSLVAALSVGAALAYATDVLVIDKDSIKVEASFNFGNRLAPLLTLWNPGYTIGIQPGTMYFRTDKNFGWFQGGKQDATTGQGELDAGGGTALMSLSSSPAAGKGTLDVNGTITARSITGLGAAPVGAIVMWYGTPSTVPDGWVLCDGANGTPDLSGRFIVGYMLGDADYTKIGNTGGEKQITLTAEQMPRHKHTGTTGNDSGVGRGGGSGASYVIARANHDSSGYFHSHPFTTDEAGGSLPHENRPPFAVLAYIMYKGWSLPQGTYRESCRRVAKDGNSLTAECAQPSGAWQPTKLDVETCKVGSNIDNSNGVLVCTKK